MHKQRGQDKAITKRVVESSRVPKKNRLMVVRRIDDEKKVEKETRERGKSEVDTRF